MEGCLFRVLGAGGGAADFQCAQIAFLVSLIQVVIAGRSQRPYSRIDN